MTATLASLAPRAAWDLLVPQDVTALERQDPRATAEPRDFQDSLVCKAPLVPEASKARKEIAEIRALLDSLDSLEPLVVLEAPVP